MSDDLLHRINTVCSYYRGADWSLQYDSAEGGFWSLRLMPPATETDEPEVRADPMFRFFAFTPRESPIFAMRCQLLDVLTEALEHWHARVILESGRQETP